MDDLNAGNIWILNFVKFGFQMVRYSNSQFMGYVLYTRLIILIPNQYIRKQNGNHLSDIQVVRLSCIQMTFKYQTIWHPTSFCDHLNAELVWYSDSHCIHFTVQEISHLQFSLGFQFPCFNPGVINLWYKLELTFSN